MEMQLARRTLLAGAFGCTFTLLCLEGQIIRHAYGQIPEAGIDPSLMQSFANSFTGARFIDARATAVMPELVNQQRPVIIIGQKVSLNGKYTTNGFPLAVIARELSVASNTVIDTSGSRGDPNYLTGNRALDGANRGSPGANGEKGGQGTNAGNVIVVCDKLAGTLDIRSNGGPGGNGRAGGNGMVGRIGANGRKRPNCENGSPGGAGGDAGFGGEGGAGGVGGQVLVQTRRELLPDQVTALTAGGTGGIAGVHGSPGEGGEGGSGTAAWERNEGGGPQTGGGNRGG